MKQSDKATLIGLMAIILWSTIVGLIRSVSDYLGPTGGAALIYTLASLRLFAFISWMGEAARISAPLSVLGQHPLCLL